MIESSSCKYKSVKESLNNEKSILSKNMQHLQENNV